MINGLILGEDERVAAWVHANFDSYPMRSDRAVGIIRPDGVLIGAFLLQNYNGVNIELSYYGPRTVSNGIIRSIARIALSEFNIGRATILTSKRNRRLIQTLFKFGWRVEGTQRCFYGYRDCRRNTAVRLVMFREQIAKIARFTIEDPRQRQG